MHLSSFVHAKTFGASEQRLVDRYEVVEEEWGCRSVQEQWFDNPEDPGVAAGIRPVRQRRRATYVYRAPFQLMLRLEELGGVPDPPPDVVRSEVAFEEAVLAEDRQLQNTMRLPGLPLRMRDELHLRRVHLRRVLGRFREQLQT